MIIRYRNYSFPIGAASYTDEMPNEHTDAVDLAGNLLKIRAQSTRRITIDAWIQGSGAADIKAKITAFEQAFSVDGGDFIVTSPTGVEVCAIRNADTLTGLRVTAISYPDGKGTEFVNKRTVRVTLECELSTVQPNAGGLNGATEFSQQITFTGTGGPRFTTVETMDGPPIKFQLCARTRCTCVQQGTAASRFRQLSAPAPIFPQHEKLDQRQISLPDSEGRISWSYTFESAGPFG